MDFLIKCNTIVFLESYMQLEVPRGCEIQMVRYRCVITHVRKQTRCEENLWIFVKLQRHI